MSDYSLGCTTEIDTGHHRIGNQQAQNELTSIITFNVCFVLYGKPKHECFFTVLSEMDQRIVRQQSCFSQVFQTNRNR